MMDNRIRPGNKASRELQSLYNTVIIVYTTLSNTLNTLFLSINRLALQSPTMDKIKEPSRSQVIINDTLWTEAYVHGGEWFLCFCTSSVVLYNNQEMLIRYLWLTVRTLKVYCVCRLRYHSLDDRWMTGIYICMDTHVMRKLHENSPIPCDSSRDKQYLMYWKWHLHTVS